MAVSISYAELLALGPCEDRLNNAIEKFGGAEKWGDARVTAKQACAAGVTFSDLVWVSSALARKDKDVERRLRLWIADCAARVLNIYEKTESSTAPRNAIVAARQFARGKIRAAAWAAVAPPARDAARDAAWDAAWDAQLAKFIEIFG